MTLDEKIIEACGRIRDRDDAISVVQAAVAAERERCIQAARDAAEKFKANGAPDHAVGALDVISHIVQ